MAVSADYVHAFSRDLLMSLDLNPRAPRDDGGDLAARAVRAARR